MFCYTLSSYIWILSVKCDNLAKCYLHTKGFISVLRGIDSVSVFRDGIIIRGGVILVLSLDLMGSTPVYKSGLHEDRLLKVILDEKKCKGAGFCEQVCPRNCYELDKNRHIAIVPRSERCVQCGACIVQCPFDALYFKSPKGEIISPATVRKFKLNLIGRRLIKAD